MGLMILYKNLLPYQGHGGWLLLQILWLCTNNHIIPVIQHFYAKGQLSFHFFFFVFLAWLVCLKREKQSI